MARAGLLAGLCAGLVVCASVEAFACSPNRLPWLARYVKPVDLGESPGVRPGHAVFYATPVAFEPDVFWMKYPSGEVRTRTTLTVRVGDVLLGDVRSGETVELNVGAFSVGCTRTNATLDLFDVLGESDEVLPGRELLVDIDTAEWLGLTRRRAFSGRHWRNERVEKGSSWRVLEPGEEHARSFEELARRLNHDEYGSYVGKGLLPLKKRGFVIETEDGPIAPEVPEPEQVPELRSFEDELAFIKAAVSECVPEPGWVEALGSDLIVHGTVTSAYQKGAHGEVSYRLKVGKAYKVLAPKVPDEVTLYASELTPGFRPELGTPYLIYARGTAMGYVASGCGASRRAARAPWRVGPWFGMEPGGRVFEEVVSWDDPGRFWGLEPAAAVEELEVSAPRTLGGIFAEELDASGGRAALWASLIALSSMLAVHAYRRRG